MEGIDSLRAKVDLVNLKIDELEAAWDYSRPYDEYAQAMDSIWEERADLYRRIRLIDTYTLSPISIGNLYTMDDFKEDCLNGSFIDYDGFGYYSDGEMESDIHILPSDIKSGCVRDDFDYVVWYNR